MKKKIPQIPTLKVERLSEIANLINRNNVSINDLCVIFGRSRPTIFRWVRMIKEKGLLEKPLKQDPKGRPRLRI